MKAKLLVKIRKRYQYYWQRTGTKLVVIDNKKKSIKTYFDIREFLIDYLSDKRATWELTAIYRRYQLRQSRVEYRKSIREFEKQLKNG